MDAGGGGWYGSRGTDRERERDRERDGDEDERWWTAGSRRTCSGRPRGVGPRRSGEKRTRDWERGRDISCFNALIVRWVTLRTCMELDEDDSKLWKIPFYSTDTV